MDDLQTNDNQDTELPDSLKNWVAAQDTQKQSIQPPPAVAQLMKAQSQPPVAPVAMPQMDPSAQAQQILQPQGSRSALAAKLLQPSIGQTIGNAFAGIGDAIGNSHGGHTEFLKNAMEGQRGRAGTLLESADKDADVNKEKFALSQQLMKKDPKSLISQQTQAANAAILAKTLGLTPEQIAKMSAEQIEGLGGKPVDLMKAQGEHEVAMEGQKLRGETNVIAQRAQSENERFHREEIKHQDAQLAQEATNQGAQRAFDKEKQGYQDAEDVVKETSRLNPLNLLPGSDRARALKKLADGATETVPTPSMPRPGEVVSHTDGTKWQFVGTNPADKNSWKKI